MVSTFFGELCCFGVFEDSFLPVDYPFDHSIWFRDFDESAFFEFVEAVVGFAVGEGGGFGDLLDVGVSLVDLVEYGQVLVSEFGHFFEGWVLEAIICFVWLVGLAPCGLPP